VVTVLAILLLVGAVSVAAYLVFVAVVVMLDWASQRD